MKYFKTDLILKGVTYNKIDYTINCNTTFAREDRVGYIEYFQKLLDEGKNIIHEITKTQCYEFHMNWKRASKLTWISKAEDSLIIYQIFNFKELSNGYGCHYSDLWKVIKSNKEIIKTFSKDNEWYVSIRPNNFELLDVLIKTELQEEE